MFRTLSHHFHPRVFFLQHGPSSIADTRDSTKLSAFMQRARMPHGDLIVDVVRRVSHLPPIEPGAIQKGFHLLQTFFKAYDSTIILQNVGHILGKKHTDPLSVEEVLQLLERYTTTLPNDAENVLKALIYDLQISGIQFPDSVSRGVQAILESSGRAPYEMVEAYQSMDRSLAEFREYAGNPYLGETPTVLSRQRIASLEKKLEKVVGNDDPTQEFSLESFCNSQFYEVSDGTKKRNSSSIHDVIHTIKRTPGYRKKVLYPKKFERDIQAYFSSQLFEDAKKEFEEKKQNILGSHGDAFQKVYGENIALVRSYISSLDPHDTDALKQLSQVFLSQPRYFARTGDASQDTLLRERLAYVLASNYTTLFQAHAASLDTRIKKEGKNSRTRKQLEKIIPSFTAPVTSLQASIYYADILMRSLADTTRLYDDPSAGRKEGKEKWLRRSAEVGSRMKHFFGETVHHDDHWIQKGVTALDKVVIRTTDLLISKGIGDIIVNKALGGGTQWVDKKVKENRTKLKEFQKNVMAAKSEKGAWNRMKWLARQPFRPFTKLLSGALAVTSGVTGTTAALARGTSTIVNSILTHSGNAYNTLYGNRVPGNDQSPAPDPKGIVRSLFQLGAFTGEKLSSAGAWIFDRSYDMVEKNELTHEMEHIKADLAGDARPLLEQLGLLEVLTPRTELSLGLDVGEGEDRDTSPPPTPSGGNGGGGTPPTPSPSPSSDPPSSPPEGGEGFDAEEFIRENTFSLIQHMSLIGGGAQGLSRIRASLDADAEAGITVGVTTTFKKHIADIYAGLLSTKDILLQYQTPAVFAHFSESEKELILSLSKVCDEKLTYTRSVPDVEGYDREKFQKLPIWSMLDSETGFPSFLNTLVRILKH